MKDLSRLHVLDIVVVVAVRTKKDENRMSKTTESHAKATPAGNALMDTETLDTETDGRSASLNAQSLTAKSSASWFLTVI